MYNENRSRVENILQSTIDGSEYDRKPLSRVEELLLEIKEGGGGGGTTDYNTLNNKPTLNGVTIQGNLTSSDLNVEENHDVTYDADEENVIITPST